jgi:hypothetical protein
VNSTVRTGGAHDHPGDLVDPIRPHGSHACRSAQAVELRVDRCPSPVDRCPYSWSIGDGSDCGDGRVTPRSQPPHTVDRSPKRRPNAERRPRSHRVHDCAVGELASSGEKLRMHDLWVARPVSYPHNRPLLHPPLHPPGGASLHPLRALSLPSGAERDEQLRRLDRSELPHQVRLRAMVMVSQDNA